MEKKVRLKGEDLSRSLKKVLEECGVRVVGPTELSEGDPAGEVPIYEVTDTGALDTLQDTEGPYLVFASRALPPEKLRALKEGGLAGVITPDSTPEEIAFFINKALFQEAAIRRNPRVPVNLPVRLDTGSGVVETFASLLSREGMFVVTINPLPVGSTCEVEFTLPDEGERLSTPSRVLYQIAVNRDLNIISNPSNPFKRLVSHPGMAVYFTGLGREEKKRIDEYIESVEV